MSRGAPRGRLFTSETPRLLFPSLLLVISLYLSSTSFPYLWNPHITLRLFLNFSHNCFPIDAFLINLQTSRPSPTKKLYAEFRFAIEKKEDNSNDEGV